MRFMCKNRENLSKISLLYFTGYLLTVAHSKRTLYMFFSWDLFLLFVFLWLSLKIDAQQTLRVNK